MAPQWPLIVEPDFVTESVTRTPMYEGTLPVGGGLFPGSVVNVVPQTVAGLLAGSVETVPSKPLCEAGPGPPVIEFAFDHESLHQVTFVDGPAAATVRSPRLNAPRVGNANTI